MYQNGIRFRPGIQIALDTLSGTFQSKCLVQLALGHRYKLIFYNQIQIFLRKRHIIQLYQSLMIEIGSGLSAVIFQQTLHGWVILQGILYLIVEFRHLTVECLFRVGQPLSHGVQISFGRR